MGLMAPLLLLLVLISAFATLDFVNRTEQEE